MEMRPLPEQSVIQEALIYTPETGLLIRRKPYGGKHSPGTYRTRRNGKPWLILQTVKGKQYAAHRLIWKLVTGDDPKDSIDHIDRNPFNNRWSNLRLADTHVQAMNREWDVTLGHKGVSFHKATGKWQARKWDEATNKRLYLGCFATKELAIEALKS